MNMFGFRGWKMGRRGWLRPLVLAMVARSPKNGAQIMDEIERMSWGGWRPSPGSVYPLLDDMASEGLIKKREDGSYEITEKGKAEADFPFGMPFQHRAYTVEDMVNEINGYVSYFEDLSRTDRSKIALQSDKLRGLADRLSRLVGGA